MLKKIKCYLFGHDWVQKGGACIKHTVVDGDEIMYQCNRDHFLLLCRRCHDFKELHCEYHYDQVGEFSYASAFSEEEE